VQLACIGGMLAQPVVIGHHQHFVNANGLQPKQNAPDYADLLMVIHTRPISADPAHIVRRGWIGDDSNSCHSQHAPS
jgi:hypothetical protein